MGRMRTCPTKDRFGIFVRVSRFMEVRPRVRGSLKKLGKGRREESAFYDRKKQ